MDGVSIVIAGDYDAAYISHRETGAALEAAGRRLGLGVAYEWVGTEKIASQGTDCLDVFDGLWAAPGSPYRSLDGALAAIRFARERRLPFLGT